jgi:NAD(P)-dependent dehydrogenase (short-subunit alcohol dehydrogenase family)
MKNRLKDKAIIIVGSGSGIGAATANRLAAEGARVCCADINEDGARKVAAEITANGGQAFAVAIDISDEASVNKAIEFAVAKLGRLDGAHINAADLRVIMQDSDAVDIELEAFDRTLTVNLRGHLLCTRAIVPHLLKAGGGALVYTSSGAADSGEPTRPAYAASKSGLNAFMRHVASRWGREGITANCVAPGVVLTQVMAEHAPKEFLAAKLAECPHRRLGQVDDIAGVVAMLLSTDGQWINGQVYNVNGGALMR